MKRKLLLLVPCLALCAIGATFLGQTLDLRIQNATDTVALQLVKASPTANWIEAYDAATLTWYVPASGIMPVVLGGTGAATAAGARASLGIPETATNTVLTLAAGGTASALADPGADRILFWDDTAGSNTWATVGTGLAITDTTLAVSTVPIANGGTGAATAAAALTAFGVQSGSVTTAEDGTVTNTFATVFGAVPTLVIAQQGEAVTVTNNVVSLTESNFVYSAGAPAIVAKFHAIGTP